MQNVTPETYLNKLEEFLHYHNQVSEANRRDVMKQATKLVNGEGIHYASRQFGWEPHQVFNKGIKVNQSLCGSSTLRWHCYNVPQLSLTFNAFASSDVFSSLG